MAKLTISAISTLTAMPTTKPSFGVTPNPNMMPTSQDKAPVLLSIKSEETIDAEKFAELFAAECEHFDVVEAARRISALGEVIAACAAECQNVQLGFANLEVNVTGTIPDTNAPLNDANKAEYIAIESAAVRKTFAGIDTHIPTSVTPADFKRIRDVATGDNKIHGTDPFFIQGLKLTTGGSGEKVELMNESNTVKVADVEVLDGSSEISVKAKLASNVESGRYYLLVTTLAGGEGTLYPIGNEVTVIDGQAPEGEPKIASMIGEKSAKDGVVFNWEDPSVITLENASTEGAKVRRVLYDADGDVMADTGWDMEYCTLDIVSPTVMKFTANANGTKEPSAIWANIENEYDTRTEVEVMLLNGTILKAPLTFESED